jgi:hypothetical protein
MTAIRIERQGRSSFLPDAEATASGRVGSFEALSSDV